MPIIRLAHFFAFLVLCGCITTGADTKTHSLDGKIFDATVGRFISKSEYLTLTNQADILLLGEVHDNPIHHKLQAEVIQNLQTDQRGLTVYFEHIATDKQDILTQFNSRKLTDLDQLKTALEWDKSGWPPFDMFRPLFDSAQIKRAEIRAALFPRSKVKSVYAEGMKAAIDEVQLKSKKLDELPGAEREKLLEDIVSSHCGMFTKEKAGPMGQVQMAKDAFMAIQLTGALQSSRSVLIAGNGHTRTDYGVPLYLKKLSPQSKIVSVAHVEVQAGSLDVKAYQSAISADIFVFTEAWPRKDPCEEMRKMMNKGK
jgi:uncharacterized iron-regulated protein